MERVGMRSVACECWRRREHARIRRVMCIMSGARKRDPCTALAFYCRRATHTSLTSQRRMKWTPLKYAIQHGEFPYTYTALAEYLRSVGARMSIHDAAFFGDVAVVQECLLANPACINEKG